VNNPIEDRQSIDINTIAIGEESLIYRVLGADGVVLPYFINGDEQVTFFVLKAANGNTFVIPL